MAPIAGHHIQWMGNLANMSSTQYSQVVMRLEPNPEKMPTAKAAPNTVNPTGISPVNGKTGPAPKRRVLRGADPDAAQAAGTRLLGFHSKSNSSTASNTAATGLAKMAAIPPAAPATSNVFRS